ncbi:MAG TPA: oxidoreductase [Alphaproteobacteria bacterium]|nr:oxidoreductase [Alphaproteobacteria bacterium]
MGAQRITVVTGANRGLGRAVSLAAAQRGDHVVAVGRTVGGLEELDDAIKALNGTSTLVPLDLTDREGVNRLGASLFERFGRIDGLFANAAILGPLMPLSDYPADKFLDVINTNLLAIHDLYRSLYLPLKQAKQGRVLFVSSGVAQNPRPFWGAYAISKAAIENYAHIAAKECQKLNINVNVIDPGALRTGMRAQAMPGEDPNSLRAPEVLCPSILHLLSDECDSNGEFVSLRNIGL